MFFVYLLKSQKNGRFYIGYTNNLEEHARYHNAGRSTYTKHRGPWELIAHIKFKTRSEAMIEERRIKKLKNRQAVLEAFNLK